ncbi:DUF459 domain-containing protein [Desulfovibrio aerotolerans]|uniref:DUF459 domain-containing protein n=1 Tax=Solidesulfovibrio aerotolerans TaxID=295255 RepID=A0A7C9ILW0_9BACT|nr:DUF459 domain-containing protein [Solidesulfovibrio aerotolerans]MYL82099.1 DUF459 domain-containing protein [Solidesulfovibrio aerotolerans]
MPAYPRIILALLLAALVFPGCAKRPAKAPAEAAAPEAAAPLSPEAAIKPAPSDSLPAAVPPTVPDSEVAASPATPPALSGMPEQATKQALEPKIARTAALTPPRSEPVAPSPQAATPPPAPTKGTAASVPPAPEAQTAKAAKTKTAGRSVAVVGDSLAVGVGMTMEQRLQKTEGLGCLPLGKVSTGLISKKYDWDKALAELLAKEPISAVVVVLGGNDANNAIAGKGAGTPEWHTAYVAKAERFLRIAEAAQVKVLWVGLPAMKEAAYARRVEAVNAAAKSACSKVTGCVYMEAADIFTDASGNYVQAKDIGGKTVSLRAGDGVHMTMTGYDLLCRRVLDKLELPGARPRQE